MFKIAKFQLPPIKGTDIFPEVIKSPPIVRASVEYLVDNKNPLDPQILEDWAKDILAENSGVLGNFVRAQRQQYNAGIVDFAKHRRAYPEFDVSYMNLQGRHEVVNINLRLDIRRKGAEEEEADEMMLLVLHDGNRISAIPMAQLNDWNYRPAYSALCEQSFWGNQPLTVNQLRLGQTYSVIASDIWLHGRDISFESGVVMIADDDMEYSLDVYALDIYLQYAMNGTDGTIYLPHTMLSFMNGQLIFADGGAGNAVSAAGDWKIDTASTQFVNDIASDTGEVTIREISVNHVISSVTSTTTGTAHNFVVTGTEDYLGCGVKSTISAISNPINSSTTTEYVSSASFDGISLGAVTAIPKDFSLEGAPRYIATLTTVYTGYKVTGYHWAPPRGDGGVYGPYYRGAGTQTLQYVTTTPVNEEQAYVPDYVFCQTNITGLDLFVGGDFASTDTSIDLGVDKILAEAWLNCASCAKVFESLKTGAAYTDSLKSTTYEFSGTIGAGTAYKFPYAVDGKLYYEIQRGTQKTIRTPYDQIGTKEFYGFFNVSNGEHLIQGFELDRQKYIMLNGVDVGYDLATAIGTDVESINSIFMDIPLSKIKQFQ